MQRRLSLLALAAGSMLAFAPGVMAQEGQNSGFDSSDFSNMDEPQFTAIVPSGGAGGTGDDLGSHIATQALEMSNFDISGANDVYALRYFHLSDINMKENIAGLESGVIYQLRPVSYTLIDGGDFQTGFIAQDVENVAPYMVRENADGNLTVDYMQVIAPLVAEVQKLNARIAELEAAAQN